MIGPVWVTGAQGFIGNALIQLLEARNVQVVKFGRAVGKTTLALTKQGLATAIDRHGIPSRVYHLAGGATVGSSIADPHSDYLSNTGTTECVLEALRPLPPVPFVLTSSAAVYGSGHDGAIRCDAPLRPGSPYGHHKLMAEHLAHSHAQTFDTPVTICRLFSIYGAGLQKQLIFDACNKLSKLGTNGILELGGSGKEKRDWLHIADAIRGLANLTDPEPGELRIHNLASGTALTINEVATVLVDVWGQDHSLAFSGQTRPGDPFSLIADPASLPPDFAPEISLRDGLSELVIWFREKELRS